MSEVEFIRVWSIPCYDFINDKGGKQKVTAIIAPIRIVREGNITEVGYACNHALACKNQTCRYSKTSYQNNKTFLK